MKRSPAPAVKFALCLMSVLWLSIPAVAQIGSLRGQVKDESGAVVPAAPVTLNGPSGLTKTTKASPDGIYVFFELAPGDYTLRASAPQLLLRQPVRISLRAAPQTLDLVLHVLAEKQEVTVEENAKPAISTEASANASAVVLRGTDLDALSDKPDDLAADLQALAGPAAGPNGGAIFIDGFSGGQLPPKNSIREIRINQNPFSPEYDKLGFGRVEILTKPGTEKFHADLGYNFATDKWNSRNPYAAEKAPFIFRCRSATSRITTIRARSSATSHRLFSARPTTRRLGELDLLRERRQPAFGTANEVHLLTPAQRPTVECGSNRGGLYQ